MNVLNLMGGDPILTLLTSLVALSKKKPDVEQPNIKPISSTNSKPEKNNNLISDNKSSKINVDKSNLTKKEKLNDTHNKFDLKDKKSNMDHSQNNMNRPININKLNENRNSVKKEKPHTKQVDKYNGDECSVVTTQDLVDINNSIKDSIYLLVEVKEKIDTKIKSSERLLHEKDSCEDHCCHEHEDEDDDDD